MCVTKEMEFLGLLCRLSRFARDSARLMQRTLRKVLLNERTHSGWLGLARIVKTLCNLEGSGQCARPAPTSACRVFLLPVAPFLYLLRFEDLRIWVIDSQTRPAARVVPAEHTFLPFCICRLNVQLSVATSH